MGHTVLRMTKALFLLAITVDPSVSTVMMIPSDYDTMKEWGHCVAFMPENQGTCNACAAASLATTLGIRACIHNGKNLRFSSQQLWDCYGGLCESGVKIEDFLFEIVYGAMAPYMLSPLPLNASNSLAPGPIENSNISMCKLAYKGGGQDRIAAISEHKEEWLFNSLQDPQNFTQNTPGHSIRSMQFEIIESGPIVAILYLTPIEVGAFTDWRHKDSNEIFPPPSTKRNTGASRTQLHAVSVVGWGMDKSTNTFYWKILNSFGKSWGANGTGNIAGDFGLIGSRWYSALSASPIIGVECDSDKDGCSDDLDNKKKDEMIVLVEQRKTASTTIFQIQHDAGKLRHNNGGSDAMVLLITISCMSILSWIICQKTQPCIRKRNQMSNNMRGKQVGQQAKHDDVFPLTTTYPFVMAPPSHFISPI